VLRSSLDAVHDIFQDAAPQNDASQKTLMTMMADTFIFVLSEDKMINELIISADAASVVHTE